MDNINDIDNFNEYNLAHRSKYSFNSNEYGEKKNSNTKKYIYNLYSWA